MTTIITHKACEAHTHGEGHPEQPARLPAVMNAIRGLDQNNLTFEEAVKSDLAPIKAVHDVAYVDHIMASVPKEGIKRLDPDTCLSPASGDAALLGVGAVCRAVDLTLAGEGNVFCATRPPGHHAETAQAMGFCYFGNIAIAARYAQEKYGIERIAIADFDVHHGNGTQDLLWNDDKILFVSSHEMPLYPGTGAPSETGAHNNILNLPLMRGTQPIEFQAVWQPALERMYAFKPQLVLISAGFDAHRDDPLAGIDLVEDDFIWITQQLVDLANEHADGKLVSALEGGYNLDALGRSAAAHVDTLARVEFA